jgi:hypothetical protein
MTRNNAQMENEGATREASACASRESCSGGCEPRTVPVEDVVVGVIRLAKDVVSNVGGLGAVVAPGIKSGVAELSNAAGQGVKRVLDLVGKSFKKPEHAIPDEPAH